jgi:hypothetical protein
MTIMRDEIRQLCAAHDRLMAEHDEWMAQREVAAASPVQKSDLGGLLYRTNGNGAQATARAQDSAPSDGEAYPPFADLRAGICQFVVEWTARKLKERDERTTRLEAKLDAMLAIIGSDKAKSVGQKSSDDSVIDLPDWRKRHA